MWLLVKEIEVYRNERANAFPKIDHGNESPYLFPRKEKIAKFSENTLTTFKRFGHQIDWMIG